MRAEDLPSAGEHAAIFIGVGVTEHDFLTVVPCGEEPAIVGAAPEFTADLRCIAQIFNGFEEWNRHEARVAFGAFDADTAETSETDDGENVVDTGGAADDVLANGLRRAASLGFSNSAKSFEHAGRFFRETGGQRRRHGIGDRLFQCGCVDARVLTDVERMEMETKRTHLEDERIDQGAGDADALMRGERSAQYIEVGEEFTNGA